MIEVYVIVQHTLRLKIVAQQQPAAPLLCLSKVFVRCVTLTLCPPIVSRRVSNQSFLPSSVPSIETGGKPDHLSLCTWKHGGAL